MIIRFVDLLLMAGEAEIETGGLEKAREYVNSVRTRAINSKLMRADGTPAAYYVINNYTAPWTNPDTVRLAVRHERLLELGM